MTSGPTAFPDLNDVLAVFVESVQSVLGDNFCGAYLQGSFAVGDADEHSDVDFIVVVNDEVTEAQSRGLQATHARLYALPRLSNAPSPSSTTRGANGAR